MILLQEIIRESELFFIREDISNFNTSPPTPLRFGEGSFLNRQPGMCSVNVI